MATGKCLAWTELNFYLYTGDWEFKRENQRIEGELGLCRVREVKKYTKPEVGIGLCDIHLCVLTGT